MSTFDAYASHLVKLRPANVSFFRLADQLSGKTKFPDDPLRRFLALMRSMNAKTYLLEPLDLNNDELAYERDAATKRCGDKVELRAQRLTFFATAPKNPYGYLRARELSNDAIVGYAILVHLTLPDATTRPYLLESVVREPAELQVNGRRVTVTRRTGYFIHCKRQFTARVGTRRKCREFQLIGSFFAQQNDLTHVCGHAALRMAINSSTLFGEIKLTNRAINQHLDIHFKPGDELIGHYDESDANGINGLETQQLERVVRRVGGVPHTVNFATYTHAEYDHYVYPLMESGCPVMLGLNGIDTKCGRLINHLVPILGHTLNADRWSPEARGGYGMMPILDYIPAAEWADHFIISDDGYGMYQTLQADVVRNVLIPSKNASLHAIFAMGITPEHILTRGIVAEELAQVECQQLHSLLDPQSNYWVRMLNSNLPNHKHVHRTLLQRREVYLEHLRASLPPGRSFGRPLWATLQQLPDQFWVSEVTLPRLYSTNQTKLGDVIIDANVDDTDESIQDAMRMIWLPGVVQFGKNGDHHSWPIIEPIPLLKANALTRALAPKRGIA